MAGRLHEEAVESGRTAAAGYFHVSAIEDQRAVFSHIQPVMQHAPDEPDGLADAEYQDRSRRWCTFERMLAQVTQQIANPGKTRAGDSRILGLVDQFIQQPRLET